MEDLSVLTILAYFSNISLDVKIEKGDAFEKQIG